MADDFLVSLSAKLSDNQDIQKEIDKISKELTLTIKDVAIDKGILRKLQTELSESSVRINLDSSGMLQQARITAQKEAEQAAEAWSAALQKISGSWTAFIQNLEEIQSSSFPGNLDNVGSGLNINASPQNVGRHKMFCLI